MADREGFEPSRPLWGSNSLAGSPLQPLAHLSPMSTRIPREREKTACGNAVITKPSPAFNKPVRFSEKGATEMPVAPLRKICRIRPECRPGRYRPEFAAWSPVRPSPWPRP